MNFEEQMGLPARRQTEAERLTKEGLEVSKERLLESLRHTEAYLQHEVYSCLAPVQLCLGPCTQLRWLSYHWLDGSVAKWRLLSLGPVQGPAYLLCNEPSVGGPPFDCAKHWLEGRLISELKTRRLKKEYRRSLKK